MAILVSKKRISELMSLSRQAYSGYKMQISALTFLGFVAGILEGVGITAVIPLFSFITGQEGATADWLSGQIRNFFEFFNISFSVKYLLIFIAALFILKVPVVIWINYMRSRITTDYEEKTKIGVFRGSVNASWPFLLKQKSGYLETILLVDVPAAGTLLSQLGGAIMIIASLIIYFLAAINISSPVTFLTLVIGAGIFLLSKPLFHKTRAVASERAAVSKELAHHVSENILGIKSVKAGLGLEGAMRRGRDFFRRIKDLEIRTVILKSVMRAIMQPAAVLFVLALFAFSYKSQSFNLASVAVVMFLIDRIFIYLQQLQGALHTINDTLPHLKSVLKYEEAAIKNKEEDKVSGQAFSFEKSLEFRNVSFGYGASSGVLHNVSFAVRKGETVGIIGPSGVGKTTMVDLLLRLLKPVSGQVLLDRRDISEINLQEWRKNLGYVAQDIFLMNDTVANNIRFYDSSITDQELAQAAKMADIYDFIESCPDKFETVIGERGLMLSAGQRQRIVIARVLVRKPQILILDEATSALDNESESRIQKVIHNLKGKVTVIAIAHRLSTLLDSDRLIVLEEGRVAEEGEPAVLLKDKDSYFFKVYNLREQESVA